MRDPKLSPDHFLLDRVISIETIVDSWNAAQLTGGVRAKGVSRFAASGRMALDLELERRDLSGFQCLCLEVENRASGQLLVGMTLRHGSGSSHVASQWVSFSGSREILEPGVRRLLQFPFQGFGSYGFPDGWSEVRAIGITIGRDRDYEDPPEFEVRIGPLLGERREIPFGPRLTEAGLALVLDRDVPSVTQMFPEEGFSSIKSSPFPQTNWLHPYTASNSALSIPPPHTYPVESAEQILCGRIMGQNLGRQVRWNANPLGVQEWTHFLNRHHFMRDLVGGLVQSGDSRCAAMLDDLMIGWIQDNPVPVDSNGGAGPSWETLTAAWRLREWLWIAGIVWPNRCFSSGTRTAVLRSLWEHARHLSDHRGHPNNWIIVESCALALVGMCFPQFREARQWFELGLSRLQMELSRQFFEDGVHFEISPLYHSICLHGVMEVMEAAAANGLSLPAEFHSTVEKGFEYLASLCRPDFTWPSINDSGGVAGDYTALMKKAGEVFDRADFRWIGSRGAEGDPPRSCSRPFPEAGIAVMRSHWGADANVLVFRAGPAGAAHVHDDVLSLDVTARSFSALVDPGITSYAPGDLTDYYRDASAHSMIWVDGQGPYTPAKTFRERTRPAGDAFDWSSDGELLAVTGRCRGPWRDPGLDCTIWRTTVFVEPDYWIVKDRIQGFGVHCVQVCWQFAPGKVERTSSPLSVRLVNERGSSLAVVPVRNVEAIEVDLAEGSIDPPRGWVSVNGRDLPAVNCRFSFPGELPLDLVWLLLPFSGIQCPGIETERFNCQDGTILLNVRIGNGPSRAVSLRPPE